MARMMIFSVVLLFHVLIHIHGAPTISHVEDFVNAATDDVSGVAVAKAAVVGFAGGVAVNTAKELGSEAVEVIADRGSAAVKAASEAGAQVVDAGYQAFDEGFKAGLDAYNSAAEAGASAIDAAANVGIEAFKTGAYAVDAATKVGMEAYKTASEAGASAVDLATNVGVAAINAAADAIDSASKAGSAVYETSYKTGKDAYDVATKTGEGVMDATYDAGSSAVKYISEVDPIVFLNETEDALKEKKMSVITAVFEKKRNAVHAMKDLVKNPPNIHLPALSEIKVPSFNIRMPSIDLSGSVGIQKLVDNTIDSLNAAISATGETIEISKNVIANFSAKFTLENTQNAAADVIDTTSDMIEQTGSDLLKSLVNAKERLQESVEDVDSKKSIYKAKKHIGTQIGSGVEAVGEYADHVGIFRAIDNLVRGLVSVPQKLNAFLKEANDRTQKYFTETTSEKEAETKMDEPQAREESGESEELTEETVPAIRKDEEHETETKTNGEEEELASEAEEESQSQLVLALNAPIRNGVGVALEEDVDQVGGAEDQDNNQWLRENDIELAEETIISQLEGHEPIADQGVIRGNVVKHQTTISEPKLELMAKNLKLLNKV